MSSSGCSRTCCAASLNQGHGTITLPQVAGPLASASKAPSLAA